LVKAELPDLLMSSSFELGPTLVDEDGLFSASELN